MPDNKPMTPEEFARTMQEFIHISDDTGYLEVDEHQLSECITARDESIRREAIREMREEKPFLWGIEEIVNGVWKDGEQCVFGEKGSAVDEVDLLNDSFPEGEEVYRVVALYRALPIDTPPAAEKPMKVSAIVPLIR